MAELQALRKSLADPVNKIDEDKSVWESIGSSGNILKLVRALGKDRFKGLEDWEPPLLSSGPRTPVFTNAEGKGAELVPDCMSRILSWYRNNRQPSERASAGDLLDTLRQEWKSPGGLKDRIEQARGRADTERDKDSDTKQSQAIYQGVIALQTFLERVLANPEKPGP